MEATQVKTQTQQNAPAQFKPPKKKRRWVRRLVAVLVVAAILAVLLLRLMSAGTQAVAGAYLSDTAQVREMTVAVSGTGTIQPNQSYKVTTLISGEVLEGEMRGWGLLRYRRCALGWGKGSGGQIKNHYPKGLRWR